MFEHAHRLGPYEILGPLPAEGRRTLQLARLASAPPDTTDLLVVQTIDDVRDAVAAHDEVTQGLREAARIEDSAICPVRGVFVQDGDLLVVSDFVRGGSLRDLLVAGARPSKMIAVAIARDLAAMLMRLHKAGLIHGDVCPSTIMIANDGSLSLRSLGVARAVSTSGTDIGDVHGHFGYMAPERAAGKLSVTASADLYSLGLVLWELLTGERALRAASDLDLRLKATKPEVPPPSEIAKCGREIDAMVAHAIQFQREERYASAEAFWRELDRYVISRAPSTNVKLELSKLMARHLGTKLRAQQILIDRWISQANARRRQASVPPRRTPSIVERGRPTPDEISAQLFAELDLAVQDLQFDEPIFLEPEELPSLSPAKPTVRTPSASFPTPPLPRPGSIAPGATDPGARTDDLAAHATRDLPKPPRGLVHGRAGDVLRFVLLALALGLAVAAYFLSTHA